MAKRTARSMRFTLPGLSQEDGRAVAEILQTRLAVYTDLHLTLKHVHWNVVGPNFIAVHEMLDPQVVLVRGFADEVAERIAALGAEPLGTTDALASSAGRQPYPLNRATAQDHLTALCEIYSRVIADSREALEQLEELDLVTQDVIIGHTADLEQFQWFVRAHLENAAGSLPRSDTSTNKGT